MGLNNQAAREYNVSKFTIFSNSNDRSCSVNRGFVSLYYHESILENYLKATAVIADTGYSVNDGQKLTGLIEGLDLSGGERVELKLEDGYGNILNFAEERSLYIGRIKNKIEGAMSTVFVIDLVSEEFLKNELVENRVDIRFDGKISESIRSILTNFLKTEKDLIIENTDNEYSFIGHIEKPFYKCTWLGKRSVPEGGNGSTAGFFFYETYDGFNFRSIEKLLDSNRRYKKYIQTDTTELPIGYDGKILKSVPTINIDVQQKLMMGAYGSTVKRYNFYNTVYQENINESEFEGTDKLNLAGLNYPRLPDALFGKPTRIITKIQPVGVMQKIDKENSNKPDYNVDEITAQSASRYNQLFTILLDITIAGDISHRAGDLIYCDIPELTSDLSQSASHKNSGLYMIVHATHFIDAKEGAFTRLTLARDSDGRKPFKL